MVHLLLLIIYLAFISLGLPDALLGAAWPVMYKQFEVPISYAGAVSMIIAFGTIISSLQSDRQTRRWGTGKVTLVSVGMTAAALFGFSFSSSFWQLCLWAIPYGLGAGSVDASLNNYVAIHYASRHMSWLHSMWGIGATVGPSIMGVVLTQGHNWTLGYRTIAFIQVALTLILLASLPLWQGRKQAGAASGNLREAAQAAAAAAGEDRALSLREIVRIPGTKAVMLMFFCYCAIEQTAGLWAASYLVLNRGLSSDEASGFAGLFFLGITLGRIAAGFVTLRLSDEQMIYGGLGIILLGIGLLFIGQGSGPALAGLVLTGLGCAPIYPCLIHMTPYYFGIERSQAIIGVQMASAYVGTSLMPPFFGLVTRVTGIGLLPFYLLVFLLGMGLMFRLLQRVRPQAVLK